jgi:DNA-binding transcriptional ArsR family regulator
MHQIGFGRLPGLLPAVKKVKSMTIPPNKMLQLQARAQVLKSLGHPTRLFIVDELAKNGRRCVCELTEMIGSDMSTVSRHLSNLKQAGIVENRREGTTIYYTLKIACIMDFLSCIDSVIEGDTSCR